MENHVKYTGRINVIVYHIVLYSHALIWLRKRPDNNQKPVYQIKIEVLMKLNTKGIRLQEILVKAHQFQLWRLTSLLAFSPYPIESTSTTSSFGTSLAPLKLQLPATLY